MSTDIVLPSDTPARTPMQQIGGELARYRPVFVKLLADTGISEETFMAQIAQACRDTPKLTDCDVGTILGAGLRCAQLGLTPNDPRNLAWIIPRGGKAGFQLGYGGIMELARRAVPGLRFDGRPVYPNDEFELDYGKAEPLTHRPASSKQQGRGGDAYLWYVRAVFPNGQVQVHALDREGVEYHRSFAQTSSGGSSINMWRDAYDAAALKSVVIDMKRWLPASPQLAAAIAHDDEIVHIEDIQPVENIGDITHDDSDDES
jgi:recombination protein RecT